MYPNYIVYFWGITEQICALQSFMLIIFEIIVVQNHFSERQAKVEDKDALLKEKEAEVRVCVFM